MNEPELWRRFMALRAESEALAPELKLPTAREVNRCVRMTPLRIAAAVVAAAGLAALLRTGERREPAAPEQEATPSSVSEAWTTPSDVLLAPVAFDLARTVPDFSATPPRRTSLPARSTP